MSNSPFNRQTWDWYQSSHLICFHQHIVFPTFPTNIKCTHLPHEAFAEIILKTESLLTWLDVHVCIDQQPALPLPPFAAALAAYFSTSYLYKLSSVRVQHFAEQGGCVEWEWPGEVRCSGTHGPDLAARLCGQSSTFRRWKNDGQHQFHFRDEGNVHFVHP